MKKIFYLFKQNSCNTKTILIFKFVSLLQIFYLHQVVNDLKNEHYFNFFVWSTYNEVLLNEPSDNFLKSFSVSSYSEDL